MKDDGVNFRFRLPKYLHRSLKLAAKRNKRSLTGELVEIMREAMDNPLRDQVSRLEYHISRMEMFLQQATPRLPRHLSPSSQHDPYYSIGN